MNVLAMMKKKHFQIRQEIDLIKVRLIIIIGNIIVGNKIGDKIDDLTHPNESKKDKIIRKTKNYVNDMKEEANEAFGNLKEKYLHKS